MSKITTQQSSNSQKKLIKVNGINNLPKVQRKIINQKNEEVFKATKNEKIIISEENTNNIGKCSKLHNPKNNISNQRNLYPKYYKVVSPSPNIHYQIIDAKEINDILLTNEIDNNKKNKNNNHYNIHKKIGYTSNAYNNRENIYNNKDYDNNDFYESKSKYQLKQKITDNKASSILYNSSSYDIKRTKRRIRYNFNSPERNSKILVKSILCSPIQVCYTKIDKPMDEQNYKEYKEEIEETEETKIIIRTKMRKIWENEEKECKNECNFSILGEENNNKNPIIEEYEERIKELNESIFNLKKTKNTIKQEIEEYKSNLNDKIFYNMKIQAFFISYITENKKKKDKNIFKKISWNEMIKEENVDSINIFRAKKTNPLSIQNYEKFSIFGIKKPINVIDYGTYLEILTMDDEKSEKQKLKDKIEHTNIIELNEMQHVKLKSKPKFNNIIETANNIFIPRKKKELFTWDTFYGQELYILSKKKKNILEIEYLDDLEILKTFKPENKIQFNEPIGIIPEPKAPFEINLVEEFYIPESINKIKYPPKPKNKIVSKDKIRLLGKKLGNNEMQKASLIEIEAINVEPIFKIIEYDECDCLFIPRKEKEENVVQLLENMEILNEKKVPIELVCESNESVNIFALEKPKNIEQKVESFDIFRKQKAENVIDPNYFISIEAIPKKNILYIEYCDEIFIERILSDNKIQSLKGFNIMKKQKPLNQIQIRDEIELLQIEKPLLKLITQNSDLFTIDRKIKPKNKSQRVNELKILKNIKKVKINVLSRVCSFIILRQPKLRNYVQKINDINIFGKIKKNVFEIEFKDEMIIEEEKRPIYKIQRTEYHKIIKKPKARNIKQKSSELQLLKKTKIKPKNKIQKRDNLILFSQIKKNKNNNLVIFFGDGIYIERNIKPDNRMQKLKGFNILRKKKPLYKIQIKDKIEIMQKPIPPLNLICENIELFTIGHIKKPKNKNRPQRISQLEIIKNLKKTNQKAQPFKQNNKTKNKNIIEDVSNFQIISMSIRELYQQRLQGFVIYKKEKDPNEIEAIYNFIIPKEYDALLARPIWTNLFIQKEEFNILPISNKSLLKTKKELNNEYLIETNSQKSKFKESFVNDSFTNSRDLSADISRSRNYGGQKKFNENNISKQILYSRKGNNNYRNIKTKKVNIIKSDLNKTLLAIPQNEIDYINNIEICPKNKNEIIFLSDDEYSKNRKILKNKNNNEYNNRSFDIKGKAKIIEYKKNCNLYIQKNNNNLNCTNSELCNYKQISNDSNIKKNEDKSSRISNKVITNHMLMKKTNYRYNNNNDYNNNCSEDQISRYTYYRNCSNSNEPSNMAYNYQSKSQIKTMRINKKTKRKVFRFEEGKGIKIIYNQK